MIGEARRITLRYQLSDGRAIQPTEVDGSDPVAACGGFIRSTVGSGARDQVHDLARIASKQRLVDNQPDTQCGE